LHGYASEFAADLRSRGIEAWALTGPNQLDLSLSIPAPPKSKIVSHTVSAQSGFLRFCTVAEQISGLTGKYAKIAELSRYFREADDSDLCRAALWLSGNAFPASNAAPHQTGRAIVHAALIKASGLPAAEFR